MPEKSAYTEEDTTDPVNKDNRPIADPVQIDKQSEKLYFTVNEPDSGSTGQRPMIADQQQLESNSCLLYCIAHSPEPNFGAEHLAHKLREEVIVNSLQTDNNSVLLYGSEPETSEQDFGSNITCDRQQFDENSSRFSCIPPEASQVDSGNDSTLRLKEKISESEYSEENSLSLYDVNSVGALEACTDLNLNLLNSRSEQVDQHDFEIVEIMEQDIQHLYQPNFEHVESENLPDDQSAAQPTSEPADNHFCQLVGGEIPADNECKVNGRSETTKTSLKHKVKCDFCGRKFLHLNAMLRHRQRWHATVRVGESAESLRCPVCPAILVTEMRFKRHIGTHSNLTESVEWYLAEALGLASQTTTRDELDSSSRHDKRARMLRCPKCPAILVSEGRFNNHMKRQHSVVV